MLVRVQAMWLTTGIPRIVDGGYYMPLVAFTHALRYNFQFRAPPFGGVFKKITCQLKGPISNCQLPLSFLPSRFEALAATV